MNSSARRLRLLRSPRLISGFPLVWALCGVAIAQPAASPTPASEVALTQFHSTVKPILQEHCYECHGDGAHKAGLAFDDLTTREQILNPTLWLKVLRNTRSHIMPPPENSPPTAPQQQVLEQWIKTGAFGLDLKQPDPGRVTVRRLNRNEYRNSLRDLIGVDFDADSALPPDDVGYGFNNIGDVQSISPMRMEKFIEAAMAAVEKGVPQDTVSISSQMALPADFSNKEGTLNGDRLSFYEVNKVGFRFKASAAGDYRIHMAVKVDGSARPDPQLVRVHVFSDDQEFFSEKYKWSDAEYFDQEKVVHWEPGEREISFQTEPLLPDLKPLPARMDFRILYVRVEGPLDRKSWAHAPGYKRFYDREAPPEDPKARRTYAREVIARFVPKAFRRPVDAETIDQLVDLAEKSYTQPGVPFEKGVAQAFIAILASPRFLFHLETAEPIAPGERYARIDEYTLASRISYALWCSTPDDELLQLASRGELRKNFQAQIRRMLADPKGQAFAEAFSGQWLQSRGVLDIQINSAEIMAREGAKPAPAGDSIAPGAVVTPPVVGNGPNTAPSASAGEIASVPGPSVAQVAPTASALPSTPAQATPAALDEAPALAAGANIAGEAGAVGGRARGGAPGRAGQPGRAAQVGGAGRGRGPTIPPGTVLTPEVRKAMKQEAEAYFTHVVQEDRSVLEFLQSNYTFVNEQLAPVYGLKGITGPEMRKVTLPSDSLRGGVLTMGSVLTVTSNPTRTSPVKRGKWILENILGAPPAPPPPNIPALEETQTKVADHQPTQRELLALHRADSLCASCHSRMDPLGLAMESFNGFGRGRTQESGQPIDPAGEMFTGEKFSDVRELKRALAEKHRTEFYRTLTEKLLTYTLGRGVEYYDVPTVDRIVERLEKEEGRFSALLFGVLESAPFQQRRATPHAIAVGDNSPAPRSLITTLSP